jgi:hypothetical protein
LPGKIHLAKRTPDHAKQSGKSEADLERVFDTPWHVP